MPRVENLGDNVSTFCEEDGNGSSTWDVCNECHEELEQDSHVFDKTLAPYNGDPDGSDGRGGDCEHPPFDEMDYHCDVCGVAINDDNA